MKNFLRAISANKWDIAGMLAMTIAAECFRMSGVKSKELSDIWQEAEKITKDTSGD